MTEGNARSLGLVWTIVCCPLLGWSAGLYGDRFTQGHLGVSGGILLLLLLPAALAGGGNALLGRNSRSVLKAGLIAAAVCYLGFLLFVLIFFLTVPSDFFQ